MTNKMTRLAGQVLLGFLALAFTVACNSKKEKETKDTVQDTATVKPLDPPPNPPIEDTAKMDTADTRPVKTPD
jgi:hypothetical protein